MSLRVYNRCLYGSRIYSTAHKDSDYDDLYILEDDSMAEAWALCKGDTGTLTFVNQANEPDEKLPPQPFTDAFFRNRDFLLFFDAPERKQSAALISLSHYKALIRANVLWVLEILFSHDRFKHTPESLRNEFSPRTNWLKAQLKYEIQHAISKGISFLRQNDPYKAHKNFYFAHRFVNFVKQMLEHGEIVDYEEPVSLFYLRELTKQEAVKSVWSYCAEIPALAELREEDLAHIPVKIAPEWIESRTINVKERQRDEIILDHLATEEIIVNRRTVNTPSGVLTRDALLDANVSMAYFSELQIFGETQYHADIVPTIPLEQV